MVVVCLSTRGDSPHRTISLSGEESVHGDGGMCIGGQHHGRAGGLGTSDGSGPEQRKHLPGQGSGELNFEDVHQGISVALPQSFSTIKGTRHWA